MGLFGLFSNAVRKTNVTGVKKNFLKLTLDKSHFITERKRFLL